MQIEFNIWNFELTKEIEKKEKRLWAKTCSLAHKLAPCPAQFPFSHQPCGCLRVDKWGQNVSPSSWEPWPTLVTSLWAQPVGLISFPESAVQQTPATDSPPSADPLGAWSACADYKVLGPHLLLPSNQNHRIIGNPRTARNSSPVSGLRRCATFHRGQKNVCLRFLVRSPVCVRMPPLYALRGHDQSLVRLGVVLVWAAMASPQVLCSWPVRKGVTGTSPVPWDW